MRQWPDEQTRTPNNACLYRAEVVIDGKRYSARSRRGAPFALARVLVAAGVLDQPVSLTHEGLRGAMTYRSLHRMATRTIEESVRTPVGDRQFREFPEREGVREGTVIAAAAPGGEPENGGSGTSLWKNAFAENGEPTSAVRFRQGLQLIQALRPGSPAAAVRHQ